MKQPEQATTRRDFLLSTAVVPGLLTAKKTEEPAPGSQPQVIGQNAEDAFNRTRPRTDLTFDMRNGLTPSRLTIAMWDYSWLMGHYPGGPFENFERVFDELVERGFNTVRIDAFPLIIAKLTSVDQSVPFPAEPLETWGFSNKDWNHAVASELFEFMRMARRKNVAVILSSWGKGDRTAFNTTATFWKAWEKVLTLLEERDLLTHVLYVDFDQEFPYFSPFAPELKKLGEPTGAASTAENAGMEAAGKRKNSLQPYAWNTDQMVFVRSYFDQTLAHFQARFPSLRFTFSLTGFWDEVRALNLRSFDVLELHIWIHSPRFNNRTGFYKITKDRGSHDYKDYMLRISQTMQTMRPMLMQDMINQINKACDWGNEIAAPVVTTEAWGPWWHMDHRDLRWDWLYDWCEDCSALAAEAGFWGITPWNYSHPYWANWSEVGWYRRVNDSFRRS